MILLENRVSCSYRRCDGRSTDGDRRFFVLPAVPAENVRHGKILLPPALTVGSKGMESFESMDY